MPGPPGWGLAPGGPGPLACREVRRRLLRERAGLAVADRDVVVLVHHEADGIRGRLAVVVDLQLLAAGRLERPELAIGEVDVPDREELTEGERVLLGGLHVDDPAG